ncbi:hypothetical protein CGRA01v4_12583 [Colletotrichum graminicola]|nr:hypothetical protein CGRA01v4_12583 [Colletotrichum graminicola]
MGSGHPSCVCVYRRLGFRTTLSSSSQQRFHPAISCLLPILLRLISCCMCLCDPR